MQILNESCMVYPSTQVRGGGEPVILARSLMASFSLEWAAASLEIFEPSSSVEAASVLMPIGRLWK